MDFWLFVAGVVRRFTFGAGFLARLGQRQAGGFAENFAKTGGSVIGLSSLWGYLVFLLRCFAKICVEMRKEK